MGLVLPSLVDTWYRTEHIHQRSDLSLYYAINDTAEAGNSGALASCHLVRHPSASQNHLDTCIVSLS